MISKLHMSCIWLPSFQFKPAKKILKWQPRIGLEEGLKKTIAYYKPRV